jgi:hypothetical protein
MFSPHRATFRARDRLSYQFHLRLLYVLALALCVFSMSGCATYHYNHTTKGTLTGKVIVEWYKPNLFKYIPDATQPLMFLRSNGDSIQPQAMITDGGSIPRVFWVFKNYSPWGYGPAFVVHDWLFRIKNCNLTGHPNYSLKDAATVMSEIMKTLMETPEFDYGSKGSMYLMYEAVQTPPAQDAWDHGTCEEERLLTLPTAPDATFTLDFTKQSR